MYYRSIRNLQLPGYLSIEIREENGSKHVYVHSKIHVNKERKISYSYSTDFTNEQILNDPQLFQTIANMYGLKVKTIME